MVNVNLVLPACAEGGGSGRSDYTEGVPGIGIVNALEVVRAFPTDDDLRAFREWVNLPDAEALAAAQGKAVDASELAPPPSCAAHASDDAAVTAAVFPMSPQPAFSMCELLSGNVRL